MTKLEALRAAHGHLLGRRFREASAAAQPFAADPAGGLLFALALAGMGEVEAAAPLLARIAEAHPEANHPLLDLLPLIPAAQAVEHLQAGLRERRHDTRLLTALGTMLAERGPMAEAVDAFRQAATLRPADAATWSNLGKAFSAEARFGEADEAFAMARRLAPDDARIAYNHAVMLLKSGRFTAGWAAFRARHRLPGRPPALPGPMLDNLDVAGRTILLRHDEGFGDTLHFIRYAKPLAERGARVIVATPPALTRLIGSAPGVASVVTLAERPQYDRPQYDFWAPLLDVPALFGDPFPAEVPYLRADRLRPGLPPGRWIGLAWAGDPDGLLDRIRSMPVAALAPLQRLAGVKWVSLQLGMEAPGWIRPMPAVRDFADTAALVAELDAVVSVDTAVAHLAAALGKTVLLMDRYDNCWRWLSGREDSPWYPSLRIVRQATPGDWEGVVARVAELLDGRGDPATRQ